MKAIFVACNQSIYDEVLDIMNRMQMRGYTGWEELMGCGSRNGEPHLGMAHDELGAADGYRRR